MNTTAETEDLARIALGKSAQRKSRIRRALIARLLNEDGEGEDQIDADAGDNSDGTGDDEERQLVRVLAAGRLLKRRRLRRMLRAKLLTERDEGVDDDESDEESGEDDGELGRLLVGNRLLRRRRVRRALLAHLIRDTAGSGEESDESEEDEEDGGDREGKFVRMVIGSRVLRRRRVRRAVLAHLLKERGDAGEESDEDDETIGAGPDLEREVARLLVGGRAIKRRRMRGALARSLRNGGDTD